MKLKLISIIVAVFCGLSAGAQIQFVNLTSLATNQTSSSAYITITNVCTNAVYVTTNSASLQIGDSLPTAFGKLNSDINYVTNALGQIQLTNLVYGETSSLAAFYTNIPTSPTGLTNWIVQGCTNGFLYDCASNITSGGYLFQKHGTTGITTAP